MQVLRTEVWIRRPAGAVCSVRAEHRCFFRGAEYPGAPASNGFEVFQHRVGGILRNSGGGWQLQSEDIGHIPVVVNLGDHIGNACGEVAISGVLALGEGFDDQSCRAGKAGESAHHRPLLVTDGGYG